MYIYVDTVEQTEGGGDPKVFSSLFPCRLNASGEYSIMYYINISVYICMTTELHQSIL